LADFTTVSLGAMGMADANSGMTRPQINEATRTIVRIFILSMLHHDDAGQIYPAESHLQTQMAGRWMQLLHCRSKEKDSQQRESCWPRAFARRCVHMVVVKHRISSG
jgi:hypothetical protein